MMLMLILLLLCRQFGEMTSGLTRLFAPLRMSGRRALRPWRGRGAAAAAGRREAAAVGRGAVAAAGRGEAAAAGRRARGKAAVAAAGGGEAAAGAISRGG